jgi:hypothetical protein
MEASAKLGENVRDAFVHVAATIMNKGLKTVHQPTSQKPLISPTPTKKEEGCSC